MDRTADVQLLRSGGRFFGTLGSHENAKVLSGGVSTP